MKLLSIVIATRNREYYCIYAIKDILTYKRDDFELVICDNSDSDIIENYVVCNLDKRLVYKHIKGRINSAINMDTAMRMASGKYVCMIGDDDAILPSIFDFAELANQNNYTNITPTNMITFFWPKSENSNGTLFWSISDTREMIEVLKCEEQLKKFVKNGLINYEVFLPRVYHGLVSRSILEKVLDKTGHIIGGLSPDIYMSISTACASDFFVHVGQPFTIAGACPNSYTAEDNNREIKWRIEDNPQLFQREKYVWDYRIPKITTSQTIWADTAMKAFDEMGKNELLNHLNQGYLFAETIKKNYRLGKILVNSILNVSFTSSRISTIYKLFEYFIIRAIKKCFRRKNPVIIINDIENIDIAICQYENYYKIKK